MQSWKVVGATAVALTAGSYFVYNTYVNRHRRSSSRKPGKAGTVAKLIIYPVKSCGGIEVLEALCTAHGLESGPIRDRQFMVADAETGEFVSIRTENRMVLISTKLEGTDLIITAPDMDELRVSLAGLDKREAKVVPCSVHGNNFTASDGHEEASQWFTKFLNKNVKFLYFDSAKHLRPVEKLEGPGYTRYGKRPVEGNAVTMFADGYPYLLCSTASVDKVNEDVGSTVVSYRNFRPNILVDGVQKPYDEDEWREIDINGVALFGEKTCGRCGLPNINPATGKPNPKAEPFNTLYKTHRLKEYDAKTPMFGMNLILDTTKHGVIRVGDTIIA